MINDKVALREREQQKNGVAIFENGEAILRNGEAIFGNGEAIFQHPDEATTKSSLTD